MPVLSLTEKLDQLDARYEEMTQQLSSAEIVNDSAKLQKLAKQHAELEETPDRTQGGRRTRIEAVAASERSKRRQKRDRRNSRGHGRR